MCDPKAEQAAMPMVLPGPPPSQPPIAGGGRAGTRQPRIAAEHRHPEGERLGSRRARQLVDEAFGEEAVSASLPPRM